MIYQNEVPIQLDMEAFCKKMKIDGTSVADQNVRKSIPELIRKLGDKTKIHTVIQLGHFQTGILEVDQCRLQIACLCYISGDVGHWIEELFRQEKYLEGYLVDEIENEVLFQTADQINRQIQKKMEKEESPLTSLYCPGDGSVGMEIQKHLLSCMKQETVLEVKMNESGMLFPEKAMLWCFGADEKNLPGQMQHSCKRCKKKDCPFRKKENF